MQTKTMPSQASQEPVMMNLFVYKVGSCTPELQMEPEGMYDRFRYVIENVNAFISSYNDALTADAKTATEKDFAAFDIDLQRRRPLETRVGHQPKSCLPAETHLLNIL